MLGGALKRQEAPQGEVLVCPPKLKTKKTQNKPDHKKTVFYPHYLEQEDLIASEA